MQSLLSSTGTPVSGRRADRDHCVLLVYAIRGSVLLHDSHTGFCVSAYTGFWVSVEVSQVKSQGHTGFCDSESV